MKNPGALRITTAIEEMDIPLIHRFLSTESTWARGISLDTVRKSLANSLCFGGFADGRQVAFARVISDLATFANLVDVFVLPEFRGLGYGRRILAAVVNHPDLQGLRRFTLATSDAHGLYQGFGFKALARPETFMERYDPDVYVRPSET
jgi:GNAT superfamily N-acetyltransferase